MPDFKQFKVERISHDDDILIEIAYVKDKIMIICTDTKFCDSPKLYHQEAYGFIEKDSCLSDIVTELENRIHKRRKDFNIVDIKCNLCKDRKEFVKIVKCENCT